MERLNICPVSRKGGGGQCVGARECGVGGLRSRGGPRSPHPRGGASRSSCPIAEHPAAGLAAPRASAALGRRGRPQSEDISVPASSCHLRKIEIRPPGDKACCSRDGRSSDSLPEVINPGGKNVTNRCGIRPPAGRSLAPTFPRQGPSLEAFGE